MNTSAKVCQTGGKLLGKRYVNEDIARTGKGFSIVIDGATGLGGPESINGFTLAEWYGQIIVSFLERKLFNQDKDIREIVTESIEYGTSKIRDYEKTNGIQLKSHEEPSLSLIIRRDIISGDGCKTIQIYSLRRC